MGTAMVQFYETHGRLPRSTQEKPKESAPAVRLCKECEEPIPAARLAVIPNARQCVKCLEALGDVSLIRAERTVWPRVIASTDEEEPADYTGLNVISQKASVLEIVGTVEPLPVEASISPPSRTQPEET